MISEKSSQIYKIIKLYFIIAKYSFFWQLLYDSKLNFPGAKNTIFWDN